MLGKVWCPVFWELQLLMFPDDGGDDCLVANLGWAGV